MTCGKPVGGSSAINEDQTLDGHSLLHQTVLLFLCIDTLKLKRNAC